jgi:hypothetical protein
MPSRNANLAKKVHGGSGVTGSVGVVPETVPRGRGTKRKPGGDSDDDADVGDGEEGGSSTAPEEGGGETGVAAAGTNFKLIKRYQPLLFLDFADDGTMVVVERPWLAIMQTFPPPLHRKKYGS